MSILKQSLGFVIPLLNLTLPCHAYTLYDNQTKKDEKSRPNIIFILTDDHRPSAMGYAGNNIIQTPEMDRLAREGVYFKNAFCTTPISAASRASILTGLYERTHKYTFQTGPVREEFMEKSYPKLLMEAGYYTGFFGKLGVKYGKIEQLFNVFEDYDRSGKYNDRRGYFYKTLGKDTVHLTRYTGEKAIRFIHNAPVDKPFCLSISFSAPHAHDPSKDQYFWDDGTDKLYQNTIIPEADLSDDKYFNELPVAVRMGFNRTRWLWRFDTPEKYQKSVKGYYRMISGIDIEIAKIRQELKAKGLDKNTVIIFMGDNGYFLGERQLADKWLMYDLSVKVPLIIYDPRVNRHEDIETMVLNIDVPSTILNLAGLQQPASWHGKSLLPVISGKTGFLQRDTILLEHLWEFDSIPPSEGVRTAEWKYFRYVNDKSIEELYNLKNDPKEIRNLAKDKEFQSTFLALRKKCDNLILKYRDPILGVPEGLMVEYIRDPKNVSITDSLPEYCWIVPKAAVFQNAFQILVSSSKNSIDKNIGNVWNSGQVRSKASSNVEHKGKPLNPNSRYYWKVRIWDKDNRLSDYSAVQEFNTGLFSKNVSVGNSFQIERINPKSIIKSGTGSYFIDFGKDAFGTIDLNYSSPKPDTLIIRLGEKLIDTKIDRKPGGTIRFEEIKLPVHSGRTSYTLALKADSRNTTNQAVQLPDSFDVILPFRYCEIENLKTDLKSSDLHQKAYFSYFDYNESSFTSSDTTLNQIWDLCKYSIKATTATGYYIDGDRERIPYEADAYINQLGHYATDREYPMARKTIEYFMNHPTWPTEWLLHTVMMVYQDYYYSGDLELIKKYYEVLKNKTLIELAREDGLISSVSTVVTDDYMKKLGFENPKNRIKDIVDWPPAQKDTGWKLSGPNGERDGHEMMPVNTVVNSFFYINMKQMAELAGLMNRSSDKEIFLLMSAKVKKAINEKLFDKTKGIYIDGEGSFHSSLHSNMLPLAFGIVPEEYKRSVTDFVKSRGMACSVYGAQYLMEGLYEAGEGQFALDLMRATNDRSWWNMIRVGSTITMEAWDMKYKPNSDWNHAWGAVPANIIPRYLWGITPKTPSFELVQIKPQPGDLKTSSIIVPTIKGAVKASYQLVNTVQKKYEIELPANTTGEFIIKWLSGDVVKVNGKVLNQGSGTIMLESGKSIIEIKTILLNIN
jgi:alpha-L-rhamnosidase